MEFARTKWWCVVSFVPCGTGADAAVRWVVENPELRVTVDPGPAAIAVDWFAVKGPKIEQAGEVVDGEVVTAIRAGHYRYTE